MGNYEQYRTDLERELREFECNFKPLDDLVLTLDESLHKLLVEEHYQNAYKEMDIITKDCRAFDIAESIDMANYEKELGDSGEHI